MILGPGLIKKSLDIPKEVVNQWLLEAPTKSTLWTQRQRRELPSTLILVLDEWITPTWSYLAYSPGDENPDPCAVGLVSSSQDATPEWQFLALPNETLATPGGLGNMPVSSLFLLC